MKLRKKLFIWEGDFNDILSEIPLNEEGKYVALAYHQNIDFLWEKMEPDYWIMDYLNESLEQVKYVKDMMQDDTRKDICKDICRMISKAINSGKFILVRRKNQKL